MITVVLQVNGKVRDRVSVPADIDEQTLRALALESEAVQRQLQGQPPRQVIVVPRRLVNIVT
jgi:leucyl-tRNA synthetase